MFYKCYYCKKEVESDNGKHFEIRFILGENQDHKLDHEIVVCKTCYDFLKTLALGEISLISRLGIK